MKNLYEQLEKEPQSIPFPETSFYNDEVRFKLTQLRHSLGKPSWESNNGSYIEWTLKSDSGIIFILYDWKENGPLKEDEYVNWRILAVNEKESKQAKEALIHFISYGTDK